MAATTRVAAGGLLNPKLFGEWLMALWAIQARGSPAQGCQKNMAEGESAIRNLKKNEKYLENLRSCRVLKLSHSGQVCRIPEGIEFDQLRNRRNNPRKGGFAFTEVKTVFLFTALQSGIIYVFLYRLVFRFLKRLCLVSPHDREH
jgi:hypothetical protein